MFILHTRKATLVLFLHRRVSLQSLTSYCISEQRRVSVKGRSPTGNVQAWRQCVQALIQVMISNHMVTQIEVWIGRSVAKCSHFVLRMVLAASIVRAVLVCPSCVQCDPLADLVDKQTPEIESHW